jgi:iron(II)-dependent oxidoreductase
MLSGVLRRSILLLAWCVPASAELVTTGQTTALVKHESEMVYVGGGEFHFGLTNEELDQFHGACADTYGEDGARFCEMVGNDSVEPAPKVWVSSFFIDRYEVTARQFRACADVGACDDTSLVTGDVRYVADEWPMVNVTWDDAQTYCQWRGKRLPTEAEWEKAARGDDGRAFPWGPKDNPLRLNHGTLVEPGMRSFIPNDPAEGTVDDSDGAKILTRPGSYPNGRSPYGTYDMAGNVSEWVADWYDVRGYTKETVDPTGVSSGTDRAIRGGNFNLPTMWARTYARSRLPPMTRLSDVGFRCAADVK